MQQSGGATVCNGTGFGDRTSAAIAITAGAVIPAFFIVTTQSPGWLVLDIPVAVVSCVLVPVALRWSVAGAIALTVLAAASPAAIPAASVAALQVAQQRKLAVAVAAGFAGIVANASRGLWRPVGHLPFGWWLVLVVLGYAGLTSWGALAQARRSLLDSLRERAERAEADQERRMLEARTAERAQIAREMHDVLAHRLSLLATYAGALEYRPDSSPERLARAAGVIRDGVHQALSELREVIGVLRDTDLPVAPDNGPPQDLLTHLPRLIEESREAGTDVRLHSRVDGTAELPGTLGRTAYRVMQEGLTNARKHAAGLPVNIVLEGQPGTCLTVDIRNPLPRDPHAPPAAPGTGTGLVGLTERVQLAGGQLVHTVTAAGEFQLRTSLPWPA
jgi:signal transduction histidine kinase